VRLAGQYGRYGYRRVHALLASQGWQVSHGRVMRIWRREGLKVPSKQPRRGRLWLYDGSCIRLRPQRPHQLWSWDFVFDRTDDGRTLKLMVVIDEYTRQCLAIHVARRIRARDAIDVFADLMETHGTPEYIRSDNAPEMVSKPLRRWLTRLGTKAVYITPGSTWENGYCESFNGSTR
jgi:transposase InsO family protein